MPELTLALLDQIIDAMQDWQNEGITLAVAINLAEAIIERDLKSWIPPERIVLEVTESPMTQDVASFMGSLLRVRLNGFELSIDDYGTSVSTMEQHVFGA